MLSHILEYRDSEVPRSTPYIATAHLKRIYANNFSGWCALAKCLASEADAPPWTRALQVELAVRAFRKPVSRTNLPGPKIPRTIMSHHGATLAHLQTKLSDCLSCNWSSTSEGFLLGSACFLSCFWNFVGLKQRVVCRVLVWKERLLCDPFGF